MGFVSAGPRQGTQCEGINAAPRLAEAAAAEIAKLHRSGRSSACADQVPRCKEEHDALVQLSGNFRTLEVIALSDGENDIRLSPVDREPALRSWRSRRTSPAPRYGPQVNPTQGREA